LKTILGLIKPDRGKIKVFNREPRETRGMIGYLPQHPLFDPNFPISVLEVVLMGRYKPIKKTSNQDVEAAMEALELVGMKKFWKRQIGELSGGEKQRVFIARAIVGKPKLLLLDEPTASIDPETQKSFYELLSNLREETTIVLVTHDIGVVSTHVDKIACLNRKLFYHGPKNGGLGKIGEAYHHPVDLITHGTHKKGEN
ncbi:MAG: ABC transporter, partial [Methanobacteriota archaeon]